MLEEDIERSVLEHLQLQLDLNPKFIHFPGETFSPERRKEWIEPRISTIERDVTSRAPNEEVGRMAFIVRCFVKVLQKGDRRGALSKLVDRVRAVIDSELLANAVVVLDREKTDVGRVVWGPVSTARAYEVTVTIGGVAVEGVDVATLATAALITGDP